MRYLIVGYAGGEGFGGRGAGRGGGYPARIGAMRDEVTADSKSR